MADEEKGEGFPIEAVGLPPAVEKLLHDLNDEQRISLQAYLEINNHLGEYPLHLVLSGLEEIRPGTTDEVMGESAKEAKWDRENRRIALFSEIVIKLITSLVTLSIAIMGTFYAIQLFFDDPSSWENVVMGLSLLVFCIGGPVAAAAFARNSGVNVGKSLDANGDEEE